MKYIVKNCPALYGVDDGFLCSGFDEEEGYCINHSDCLLKQVIERCKQSLNYSSKEPYELGRTNMAGVILAYFEIEECEEWKNIK